jgi:hypothetical protein
MIGVQINPTLDFRDHLKHITMEVRQIARVLAKRRLSPNRKQLVIDQQLKSKYHARHLGIFTDSQLDTIDKILHKAARNAVGLTPIFPTKAIHRPAKEMGLGYAPLKDKATQMGIEHLMEILNKPTDRGYRVYNTHLEQQQPTNIGQKKHTKSTKPNSSHSGSYHTSGTSLGQN